jgi:hypothetical protein
MVELGKKHKFVFGTALAAGILGLGTGQAVLRTRPKRKAQA